MHININIYITCIEFLCPWTTGKEPVHEKTHSTASASLLKLLIVDEVHTRDSLL